MSNYLFQHLLGDFVKSVFNSPIILIAAGHASGYALRFTQDNSDIISQLILIAPTWQGPLRVMGLPDGVRNGVKNLVRSESYAERNRLLSDKDYIISTLPLPFCA